MALVLCSLNANSNLTLDEAVKTALANQPSLNQAHAQSEAADARADQARAPLLPQVTASAVYSRTTANRVLRIGTAPQFLDSQPQETSQLWNSYRFELSATQLIYDFGQTTGRHAAARAAARAQVESERSVRAWVVANTRVAYFVAIGQLQLVHVVEEALENQKRHLEQVEGYVAAGERPAIDLAQSRLDVANAEMALIGKQGNLAVAKAQLNQAMGVARGANQELDADAALSTIGGEDGPTETLVDQALRARPEFASLTEQLKAQEELVRAAMGSYGPTLSVGAGATERGQELNRLRWNYYGQVILTWPLFQGMVTPARVSEAKANLAAVRAQTEALRQQVRLEIEKAQLSLRTAKATLEAANRAVVNAEERLRLAEGRYNAGVGNALEFSDATLARAAAAAERIAAVHQVSVARAQLLFALGRE